VLLSRAPGTALLRHRITRRFASNVLRGTNEPKARLLACAWYKSPESTLGRFPLEAAERVSRALGTDFEIPPKVD
jgi:hypothetical protein